MKDRFESIEQIMYKYTVYLYREGKNTLFYMYIEENNKM